MIARTDMVLKSEIVFPRSIIEDDKPERGRSKKLVIDRSELLLSEGPDKAVKIAGDELSYTTLRWHMSKFHKQGKYLKVRVAVRRNKKSKGKFDSFLFLSSETKRGGNKM